MKEHSIRRMGAFIIDMLLISVAYTGLMLLIPVEQMSQDWILRGRSFEWSFDLFGFLTAFYFVGSDLLNKGESPGKDILHLRTVRRADGSVPGYGRSLARTLLKLISICILPVAAFLYLWQGRGFTLQDYLVKTRVILPGKVSKTG
ncbi:MAG: RDD family protein [Robiginitalea sp.]